MSETDPTGKQPNEPGAKLDSGKIMADLLFDGFPLALIAVAEVCTFGAQKYTRHGWKAVPDGITRYRAATSDRRDRFRFGSETPCP
jgi:hypothetical protein